MRDLRHVRENLGVVAALVPWRMRPKLILMGLGSFAVACMDLAGVLVMVPVMELVMGTDPGSSASLRLIRDTMGIASQQGMLISLLLIAIALFSAKSLLTLAFKWWSGGVMARAQSDALHQTMDLYTTSPWLEHRRRDSSDVYQTLNFYVPAAFNSVMTSGVNLAVDALTAIMLMVGLLVISPLATIVAVVFFGGSAWLIQTLLKKKLRSVGETMRSHQARSWRYLNPAIDGLKEIRLAGASEKFSKRFSKERRISALQGRTLAVLLEVPKASLEVIMLLAVLAVGAALLATRPQEQAFAFLGVFAVAAVRMVPSLNRMLATAGIIQSNIPNLNTFADITRELRAEERPALTASSHSFPHADIEFRDVVFQFPDGDEPVLDGVSGSIPRGHTVALVGSSGAGKTTFVELLLTLFTPTSGTFTVDGRSIHDDALMWREQLGVVVQDVFLLDASIRDNITLGVDADDVDEERVQQVIEMAQLQQVIDDAPEGLDTIVGSRGTRLSGGQRQRVGIARALYRDPQVLILDEATSALDNETEAKITDTIQALQGTMTIVVVAHRLSTVKHADQILFFSKGKIAGRGTMHELAESNEEFRHLVELGNLK